MSQPNRIPEHQRQALGLDETLTFDATGTIEASQTPRPAQGFTQTLPDFQAMEVPGFAGTGWEFGRNLHNPAEVLLCHDSGRLDVRRGDLSRCPADAVRDGGDQVTIDQDRFVDAALLVRAGLSELIVWSDGADLGFGIRALEIPAGPAIPTVHSDVRQWARDADDPWLLEEVERRLNVGGAMEHLAAAGLVARCGPRDPDALRARIEAMRRGETPKLSPPRMWAQTLHANEAQAWERLALMFVDDLQDRLDALAADPQPDDEAWTKAVVQALLDRDDLDSVGLILLGAGASRDLDVALNRLDKRGETWIVEVPGRTLGAEEEQLRRAAQVTPVGWWLETARDHEDA